MRQSCVTQTEDKPMKVKLTHFTHSIYIAYVFPRVMVLGQVWLYVTLHSTTCQLRSYHMCNDAKSHTVLQASGNSASIHSNAQIHI